MLNSLAVARYRERRRSARVSMCVDLTVGGNGGQWQEETCALSFNAYGVLVALGTRVATGQRVIVRNPENLVEVTGRVRYLGRAFGGRREVAIEFAEAAPELWPKRAVKVSRSVHRRAA